MFERISKSLIISEYGNSFTTSGNQLIESFGKNHSTICEHKFNADRLRAHKISESKDRLNKELVYLYKRKESLSNTFLSHILKKHEIKITKEKIEKNESLLKDIDKLWLIEYLPDELYVIPKNRLHEGDKVIIVDFFMRPYQPIINICNVERADIIVREEQILLSYILDDVNKTEVKYDDNAQKLITNYNDKYIFKDKETALKGIELLISEKIGMLTTNMAFMKNRLEE